MGLKLIHVNKGGYWFSAYSECPWIVSNIAICPFSTPWFWQTYRLNSCQWHVNHRRYGWQSLLWHALQIGIGFLSRRLIQSISISDVFTENIYCFNTINNLTACFLYNLTLTRQWRINFRAISCNKVPRYIDNEVLDRIIQYYANKPDISNCDLYWEKSISYYLWSREYILILIQFHNIGIIACNSVLIVPVLPTDFRKWKCLTFNKYMNNQTVMMPCSIGRNIPE